MAEGQTEDARALARDIGEPRRVRTQHALLAAIFDASEDAIISTSLGNDITSWNRGAEKLFGISAEEALGRNILTLVPPEEHARIGAAVAQLSRTGKPVSFRLCSLRRDHTAFDSWVNLFPIHDADGKLHAVGAIGRDISELVKIQNEQALLATIVNASQDAIYTVATDGIVRSWNSGAEQLYGYSAEEAIGKPVAILVPPDGRREWENQLGRALRGELIREYETRRRCRDGTIVEVSISDSPVRDSAGTIVGVAAIARDITERKRTERERDLLAAIVQSSDDAIFSLAPIAPAFAVMTWNKGAERMTGFSAAEAIGRSITDLYVVPELRADATDLLQKDLTALSGHPELLRRLEVPIVRKDGARIEVSLAISGIYGGAGELLGMSTIMRDISEHKRAQREQALLAAIVQSADAAIFSLSLDFRVQSWNRGAERLFGYACEEVLGRQPHELLEPAGNEERPSADYFRDVESFRSRAAGVRYFERSLRRKDGSLFEASFIVSGIYDSDDQLTGTSAIVRDVTELKRSERQLAVLASIVNASDDAIVAVDGHGSIIGWNRASSKIYGFSEQEALGRGLDLFLTPDELQRNLEITRKTIQTGETASFEHHPGGDKSLTSLVSVFPLRDAAGDITGVGGIARDITRSKRAERELIAAREAALAASRAKSEFLSNMSHEIRTPMNAILGMAELLAEDRTLSTQQRLYLSTMQSNGEVLIQLINNILDVAKIEAGRLSLESLGFDLEELVDKTLETMRLRAHTKGLELAARILPAAPRNLLGDPLRLRQILINLLGNAIKFTEKGEVVLTVDVPEPAAGRGLADPAAVRLRFSVADTGIGIPADKLGAIFGGFSQADASITRRFGGSGLGLMIVGRLARLMGGTVEVESEFGRGSTFSVTVALRPDPQPAAAARRGVPRLGGVPILIVDDNATNRLIVREMLMPTGAVLAEADGGEKALAELERASAAGRPFRLILLDYRMPEMDGIAVAQRMLDERRLRKRKDLDHGSDDTTILMLTSDDLNVQLARLRERGLGAYLIKPIKRVELLETIGGLLNGVCALSAQSMPEPPVSVAADERPLRILLAEDAPDNRLLIKAYFKNLPYELETAEDGLIALGKFKAATYDLVLMDIQMPVMDGLTATRAMRQWEKDRKFAPTPIIALTASALEDDIQQSLEAGCDAHLSKPVRKRILLETIRRIAGAARIGAPADAANVAPASSNAG